MADDSRLTGSDLRRRARERIRAHELPDDEPVTAHARASRGGCNCVVCGATLESGQLEFRLYFDGALTGTPLLMHARCYAVWLDERLALRDRPEAIH